jgi:predicted HTH transcriptional regulator
MSELQRLIALGEGEQLDFKFRIDDKKKIARTLCAFANARGGTLLIGVKDNGKIKGVNPEEEYYMIEGAASEFCKPEVPFESHVWQEGHHLVLAIVVAPSALRHKSLDEEGKWSVYVRVDDHTLRSNKILERVWRLQSIGQKRPTEFKPETTDLLALIRQSGRVSLSQLYKRSAMKRQDVDTFLSELVYWEAVCMHMSESGTLYSIPE